MRISNRIQVALFVLAGFTTAAILAREAVDVRNYHEISDRLGTGGEVSTAAIEQLAGKGYEVLIDLRGEFDRDENEAAKSAGMTYVNIPTSWKKPRAESLDRLIQVMRESEGKKVLVHCAANYRASAMTYLYRVIAAGADDTEAMRAVVAVWEPNETWQEFMKTSIDRHRSDKAATQL